MSKEGPIRKWLRERETLVPRKKIFSGATPQWGEWEILYSIDDSPRRTIMWGDIHNLIFRLKDAATSVGKTCTIDDYRLLRTRPEELIQGLPRTHSPQVPIEELHFKSEEEMWRMGYIE